MQRNSEWWGQPRRRTKVARLVIIDRIAITVTGNRWNDLPKKETLCERWPRKISSFLRAGSIAQFSGALFWNEDTAASRGFDGALALELLLRVIDSTRPPLPGGRKPQNPQFLNDALCLGHKRVTDRWIDSLIIKIAIKRLPCKLQYV